MLIKRKVCPLIFDCCLSVLTALNSKASCDKCNFNEAYFYQLQIRSADEPMTTCTLSSLCIRETVLRLC